MTPDQALDALAGHHGILDSFVDLSGQERQTSVATKQALLRANGLELDNDAMIREALHDLVAQRAARRYPHEIVVQANAPVALDLEADSEWHLDLEAGTSATGATQGRGGQALPPLPPGLHILIVISATCRDRITLIAAPSAAPSVEDLTGQSRLWGLNAALYGFRSARNLGLGDYEDFAQAAEAAGGHGAGFLGVNPIHALGWWDTATISPYSPSHRGFLNPLHIAADKIPGLENSAGTTALLANRRVSLAKVKDAGIIDYAGYRRHFMPLLKDVFGVFQADAGAAARAEFAGFCNDRGRALSDFVLFEALSEEQGPDWRTWPDDLRAPTRSGAQTARRVLADRMQFHMWLQWLCATQVADAQTRAKRAGMPLGLYLDLAVGPRRGAAETWCEGDSIAQGVSIGAPPDHLSPGGQNWDLAAYAPGKLTPGRYSAFRQVLCETMRHAGVLRIDHVLGMNRSFWIPDDGSPGGYIRQPFASLLAIIAIEADRARTAIIGEDLGLVPDGFREAINARGLYSYSVLQYEKTADGRFRTPDTMRPQSLACFGTHDTPTLQGFQKGRDIDWWQKLGWIGEAEATSVRVERGKDVSALASLGRVPADQRPETELDVSVHTALARSPVALVSVQIDDLGGQTEARNLPGTIDEHPNWRRRNTVPVERFEHWDELTGTGRMMMKYQRGARPAEKKENARCNQK